jgi:predicted ArsR family transcriptional regulator
MQQVQQPPRYISLSTAIINVLRELGGRASLDQVLVEVWKRYVAGGNGVRVTMRLYRHPSGYYWSPDAEEALEVLEAAGVVARKGHMVLLRRTA